jgi:hypothetical protein
VLALLRFDIFDTAFQVCVASQDSPQPNEGPHDRDIHLHGSAAGQDRREHGNSQLFESKGQVAASAAAFGAFQV